MEVYKDDLLVKSKELKDCLTDLKEVFVLLQRYNMKFNSTKNAFNIDSGKFLSFMASKRGAEASLEKIKTIMNMKLARSPHSTGLSPSPHTSVCQFLRCCRKPIDGMNNVTRPLSS